MIIAFKVEGLPPKKDGAQSMWGKPLEAKRLVALRQAALQALEGQPPLQSDIGLTLKIHLPVNDSSIGDLDTFVTGICDGLMARAPGSKLHEETWSNPEYHDVRPDDVIAIRDDSQAVSIQAEKLIGDTDQQWYEVVLEGE
jgi:hypothetical protein